MRGALCCYSRLRVSDSRLFLEPESHSPLNYFSTQTYIHMKRAGVSHRGELWGDDKVETGRNVFECVSALSAVHL